MAENHQNEEMVLVTGVSGYIGAHVAKTLQKEGYAVRGTVRSLKNKEKCGKLSNLCETTPKYEMQLVEADLTQPSSWNSAVAGCTYVIHTASPFPPFGGIKDPVKEVIEPAVNGTTSVLQAALDSGTVKRVVLTSSSASVFGYYQPKKELYSEDDWTDTDSKECDHYYKSKTLAEKAAWKLIEDNPGKMELAVINPCFVLGPPLTEAASASTSVQTMKIFLERAYPLLPSMVAPVCDVRDVALAHLKAMIIPEAAGHRHIIASTNQSFIDIGKILKQEFGKDGYNPATGALPKFICGIGSLFISELKYVYPRWGSNVKFSNQRMREVLRITPTPAEQTLVDMGHAMIKMNIVKPTKVYKRNHNMA